MVNELASGTDLTRQFLEFDAAYQELCLHNSETVYQAQSRFIAIRDEQLTLEMQVDETPEVLTRYPEAYQADMERIKQQMALQVEYHQWERKEIDSRFAELGERFAHLAQYIPTMIFGETEVLN